MLIDRVSFFYSFLNPFLERRWILLAQVPSWMATYARAGSCSGSIATNRDARCPRVSPVVDEIQDERGGELDTEKRSTPVDPRTDVATTMSVARASPNSSTCRRRFSV